jgi:uridine phosphorylase
LHGSTWTTDAPFRETAHIARHCAAGVLGVEMEAAALYAFAEATGHNVPCLAQARLIFDVAREADARDLFARPRVMSFDAPERASEQLAKLAFPLTQRGGIESAAG